MVERKKKERKKVNKKGRKKGRKKEKKKERKKKRRVYHALMGIRIAYVCIAHTYIRRRWRTNC